MWEGLAMSRIRVSPAFVVALLALAVALSGTAYAAAKLPKNSVGSKQIKTSAVKSVDVKDDGLTGTDVKADSLTGADVNESTLVLPRQAGTVTLTGTSFHPRTSSTTMTAVGSAGAVYHSGGSDFLVADVVLPAGATITKAEAFVLDDSAPNNSYIQFVSLDPGTDDMVSLDSATTGPASATRTVLDLTPAAAEAVVNPQLTYQLWFKVLSGTNDDIQLWGARISYL
jgi:hypothetical protein